MSSGHVLPRRLYNRQCRVILLPAHRPIRDPPFRNQQSLVTSPSRTRTTPSASIKVSGYSSFTVLLFAGCVFSASFFLYRVSTHRDSPDVATDSRDSTAVIIAQSMADPVPPGRPGNLTPDQEAKLQELWTRTLKIFGVAGSGANIVDGHSTENASFLSPSDRTDTNDSEKKTKKSHNPFSRKHRDDAQGRSEADGKHTVRSSMDSEDKFGQTKEYNQAIASTSPEQLRQAFWSMVKHDNPDGLLLRFLRARKWDVEKALIMLISTMHWRAEEVHVDDDVIHKGEGGAVLDSLNADPAIKKEGKDFMAQIRMGKSFLHGKDKDGRPMCYVRVRLHKQGEQSEHSLERYTVYVIETARLLLSPPVDTAVSTRFESTPKQLLSELDNYI